MFFFFVTIETVVFLAIQSSRQKIELKGKGLKTQLVQRAVVYTSPQLGLCYHIGEM